VHSLEGEPAPVCPVDASWPECPYLPGPDDLWGQAAFERLNTVADALKHVAHDTHCPDEERRRKLYRALGGVLKLVDEGISIRLPGTIQFFRRYDDGHATHYEGYDHSGTLVRCFECQSSYRLHVPYLFSGTNESFGRRDRLH